MATPQGFAIRAAQARESIFASLRTVFPDAKMPEIPQVSKHGVPHLQALQWEALADWLAVQTGTESVVEPEDNEPIETEYDGLSRGELERLVEERGLNDYVAGTGTNGRAVKADYAKVLVDADGGMYGDNFRAPEPTEAPESDVDFDLDVEGDAFDSEGSANYDVDGQPISPR